ncbi:SH3 domain-containing protein [Aliigemmobacter aestuarii]|uniref:SH3 domain-containing protein n=1 Tax=Aliigemmobacter aestuarii TaxID=1445661 RepID=A0A4S3MV10_9RHOB|nr:SH3 domain-containing protein [Gemmobacter aestuarii]THD85401.1 SH3 domain-containing protein [Gemmobacter aestuarii]
MIRALALCLLSFLPSIAGAEALPALFSVKGVAANDVLNVRAAPSAEGDLLGSLPPGATGVEVVALNPEGTWGRVNIGETAGWVSMRFLAREPGPDWISLDVPMSCYGTEPFWSLDYAPDRRNMMLRQMADENDLGLWINWHIATSGRNGQIGWNLSGPARQGFATLTAERCTDGMSDREMGLSISLFLNPDQESAAEPIGLSGCCTLSR